MLGSGHFAAACEAWIAAISLEQARAVRLELGSCCITA